MTPLRLDHRVGDGYCGPDPATLVVGPCGWPLISKRRPNAALSRPFSGPQPRRGPTPPDGNQLDHGARPAQAWCQIVTEGPDQTAPDRLTARRQDFLQPLNGVIRVKSDWRPQPRLQVVVFSSTWRLSAGPIVDYDRRRFPIEFTFRQAQPPWGLADVLNGSPTAVLLCPSQAAGQTAQTTFIGGYPMTTLFSGAT